MTASGQCTPPQACCTSYEQPLAALISRLAHAAHRTSSVGAAAAAALLFRPLAIAVLRLSSAEDLEARRAAMWGDVWALAVRSVAVPVLVNKRICAYVMPRQAAGQTGARVLCTARHLA